MHGYAIVSDDDRIADAFGSTPDSLRNDADWAYFQEELDRADLVVLGRAGHLANPNRRDRRRLVLTSRVDGLRRDDDAAWWNPATLSWAQACAVLLPEGGRVAVPGGRRVFDLFLEIGYDAFHLSRAAGVRLTGGTALFSACDEGLSAAEVLSCAGLVPAGSRILDPAVPIALTVWGRAGAGAARATAGPARR